MLSSKRKIHLVGIAGIGMSGLAQILLELGHQVSGSDPKVNSLTRKIQSRGGRVFSEHCRQNVMDSDLLVYSSAVKMDNPELVMARKRGIPVIQRAKILFELMKGKIVTTVAGTHGKTTTTSLVSTIMQRAGLNPTALVGGEVNDFGGNVILGNGRYFVAEADESDGSFLYLKPVYSVITNIEEEHLDFYKDLDEIIDVYRKFADNTSRDGILFYHQADKNINRCLAGYSGGLSSFGLTGSADLSASNVRLNGFSSEFNCSYKGDFLGRVRVPLPGRHNILNALAAIGVGMKVGIDFDKILKVIAGYNGVVRRFQVRLDIDRLMVIDDYAHHPTEIEATLKGCRSTQRRIISVFQPHRYSRTRHFSKQLADAFGLADHLILTDIYSADEEAISGISSRCIYEQMSKERRRNTYLVSTKEQALEKVMEILKPKDLVVVMGAGDIGYVADELVHIAANRFKL